MLSVEIRVCPPTLLGQARQALPCSSAAVPWLSRLQAIAEDPTESSRGHFSSTQMDLIGSLFVSMGEPDPWISIINPIWAAHLVDVKEAWDRATEPYPDLTPGELPISPQLYQTEAPLEGVLAPPQLVESGVRACPPCAGGAPGVRSLSPTDGDRVCGDVTRGSPECFGGGGALGEVLSPFKLLFYELDVLGRFPLKCLFPSFPSWSRSKWWSVFPHHAFNVLHRAPQSTHDTTGVSSVLLPLRYQTKVMTALCGILVGSSSPGGGTRVPFYLVGDVVAY